MENTDWETAYETMSELAAHPLDINSATLEDLRLLPFLTEKEINDIAEYIYRYGPLRSMGELAMIKSLNYEKRQLLSYFFYIAFLLPIISFVVITSIFNPPFDMN